MAYRFLHSRIFTLLFALIGILSAFPTGVAHADNWNSRGMFCNPGGGDPCMTAYLSSDHTEMRLTWTSNRHNLFQIRTDPSVWRHGEDQINLPGSTNNYQIGLSRDRLYTVKMQSCDNPVIGSATCYGWTGEAKLWTGNHEVYGGILDKYQELGLQNGLLGYPTSDESWGGKNTGRYNIFEYESSIFWSPKYGAHPVYGDINTIWKNSGRENGIYGYPKRDEGDLTRKNQNGNTVVVGRIQNFECGNIWVYYADHIPLSNRTKACTTLTGNKG